MDNSVYEVNRDEYAGVVGQINPKTSDVEKYHNDIGTTIKIKSKKGIHFTTRIITNEDGEHYYVFNLPRGEDCLPPKAVRKITLDTTEEVQAFFEVLSKIQKGEYEHD